MKETNRVGNLFENIFGIFFSIIFLLIVNIYYKEIKFITDDFVKLIPLYNISLILGLTFHITRIFITHKVFKVITEIISNFIFLILALQLWTIFPFDTSYIGNTETWDLAFKGLIVLPAIAVSIATIVQIIELVSGKYFKE